MRKTISERLANLPDHSEAECPYCRVASDGQALTIQDMTTLMMTSDGGPPPVYRDDPELVMSEAAKVFEEARGRISKRGTGFMSFHCAGGRSGWMQGQYFVDRKGRVYWESTLLAPFHIGTLGPSPDCVKQSTTRRCRARNR